MPDSHLVRVLTAEMQRRGWNSPYALARAAGLKDDAVRDILRGKVANPRGATLKALADLLGLTVTELLGHPPAAKPNMSPREASERAELLRVYDEASPEWRGILLSMARYVAFQAAARAAPAPRRRRKPPGTA